MALGHTFLRQICLLFEQVPTCKYMQVSSDWDNSTHAPEPSFYSSLYSYFELYFKHYKLILEHEMKGMVTACATHDTTVLVAALKAFLNPSLIKHSRLRYVICSHSFGCDVKYIHLLFA